MICGGDDWVYDVLVMIIITSDKTEKLDKKLPNVETAESC